MSKELKRSKLIKERLIECLDNNEVYLHDEIEILQYIAAKRLKLATLAQAHKALGVTYNGLKLRVKSGKEMVVNLNGVQLVSMV